MSRFSPASTLRRRHDDLIDATSRPAVDRPINPPTRLLKTVTITTYPTVAGRFYGVVFASPGGTETEGTAPTFTDATDQFVAINLGASIPPAGTYLLGTLIDGRWTFRYG